MKKHSAEAGSARATSCLNGVEEGRGGEKRQRFKRQRGR